MNSSTFSIDVVPPYDFQASTHSHRYKKYHFDHYDRTNGSYKRAFEFAGDLFVAEIMGKGSVDRPELTLKVFGKKVNDGAMGFIMEQIRKQFLTQTDIKPFYKKLAKDKVIHSLCKRYYGLKPNWPGDLFECITRCIISQQINVTFADKVEMNYVRKFGKSILHNGDTFFVYPDAKTVSEIRKKDLLKIQFSERKAEYLIDLARGVVKNQISLQAIENLSAEDFRKEITRIRGIGDWTAECCLMHLGHRKVLPRGDIGLHQAIRLFYKLDKNVAVDKLLKVTDAWAGWESFATYYLWHALTDERMKKLEA
jgi:DNA-3-methyladenine glycosylase II